jgi:hypothetical protein
MATTRVDRSPCRQVLVELPARVVLFLCAMGTHSGVRAAMQRGGYAQSDDREGWALLQAACEYRGDGPDPADDLPVRAAAIEAERWVARHFARLFNAVARLHPDALALFGGVEPPVHAKPVVVLATLLERVEQAPPAVVQTLSRRGLDVAERKRLREVLQQAQSTPATGHDRPVRVRRDEELLALYRWYADWATTARGVIDRKDWLITMGVAGRRRRETAALDAQA